MHYHVHRHEVGILFHSFPYFSILYCTTAGRDAIARTSIRSRSWRSRSPMPLPRGPDRRAPAALMARTTRWSTKWSAASTRATAPRTAGHMYSIRCGDVPANKNVCRYAHVYSIWCGDGPANNVCTGLDHPHSSTCNAVTCESKLWRTRVGPVTHTLCKYLSYL